MGRSIGNGRMRMSNEEDEEATNRVASWIETYIRKIAWLSRRRSVEEPFLQRVNLALAKKCVDGNVPKSRDRQWR